MTDYPEPEGHMSPLNSPWMLQVPPESNSPEYTLPPQPVFSPPGCICPPTSEQTCENPTCPRRPVNYTITGATQEGRE